MAVIDTSVDVVQVGTGTTKHLPSLSGSDKHNLQLPVFFSFFVKNMARFGNENWVVCDKH